MPLWDNPRLEEFCKLERFGYWYTKEIRFVEQIYNQNTLRPFQDLQETYQFPASRFFQFLQLRQALATQSQKINLNVQSMPFARTSTKKDLISTLYKQLLGNFLAHFVLPGRSGWERDLGAVYDDSWQNILEKVPLVSLFPTQRLSQLFFIAQKTIAMKWLSPSYPTFEDCQTQVNTALLREHQVYQCRD